MFRWRILAGKTYAALRNPVKYTCLYSLLDTTEVAGFVKGWSAELKQSFLKTMGKRHSVAAQCLFFNVIWIKVPRGYSSEKYGVAHGHSLLEDGILGLMLCQSAVSSAKCELCNFKSC